MDMLAMQKTKAEKPLGLRIAKDILITGIIAFALSFLLVGFQLQTLQGQALSYDLRLEDVVWAIGLVMLGRFMLLLDVHGYHRVTMVSCAIAAAYLIVAGILGIRGNEIYASLFLPFTAPTVNAIFGVGSLILALRATNNVYNRRERGMNIERREMREKKRNLFNKRFSLTLGPILILLAIILPMTPWGDKGRVDTLVVILT